MLVNYFFQFLGYMKANRLVPRKPPDTGTSGGRALPPDPETVRLNF
jgi:hypothetical protein